MLRFAPNLLRRASSSSPACSQSFFFNLSATHSFPRSTSSALEQQLQRQQQNQKQPLFRRYSSGSASSPSLSIWRRKKEIGKEGLIIAKELKRLSSQPLRLDRFIRSHVSRLLKSDLIAVLAEFQRQNQVFLCMKVRQPLFFFLSFICLVTEKYGVKTERDMNCGTFCNLWLVWM